MFENVSELKRDFIPLLKYFSIKFIFSNKNPQANDLKDQANQLIYNMVVTKDFDKKVFE